MNIILFIICVKNHLGNVMGAGVPLIYLILTIMFIVNLVDILKKKDYINYDKKYNFVFIISNLALMLIMLRGMFDMAIITNMYYKINSDVGLSYRMMFVGNNLIYFNIIYICLILYHFTIDKKIINR